MENLNAEKLQTLIDDVVRKRMKNVYRQNGTTSGHIRTVVVADVYLSVLRHIGLTEYDGSLGRRIKGYEC